MSGIWYYRQDGQVFGPVTFEALQQLAQDGRLGANDEIRTGSDPDWKLVSSMGSLNVTRPANPESNAITAAPATAAPATASSAFDAHQPSAEATNTDSAWSDVLSQADSVNAQAKFAVVGQTEDVNFYTRIDGQEQGPLSHTRVTSMLHDGRLTNQDQIRSGERGDWVPIEEHPAFAATALAAGDAGTGTDSTAEYTSDDTESSAAHGAAIDTPATNPVLPTAQTAASVESATSHSPLQNPQTSANRPAAVNLDSDQTTAAALRSAESTASDRTRTSSIDASNPKDTTSHQPRRSSVSIPVWCYSTRTLGIGLLSLAALAAAYFLYPREPPHPGVTGMVTLDGQPLANATMSFLPDNDQLEPAFARTDQQGKYTLQQTESVAGAPPGKYKVRITTYEPALTDMDPPVAGVPERVPAKYNIKTELLATIEQVENNVINFPLDSNGQIVQPREVY